MPRVSPGCGLEQEKAQLRKEGRKGERIEGRVDRKQKKRGKNGWIDRCVKG